MPPAPGAASDRDHARKGETAPRDAHPRRTRDREVRRVLWLVLVVNLLVASGKLVLGVSIGALALVADAVHSLLDASSNVVGLVGIAVAARPPDAGHPYGHRRFETIAALVIGLLIAAGMVQIVDRVVVAFLEDRPPPQVSWPAAGFVALTVVINLAISRYERSRGRALSSALLVADAGHTFSDALAAIAVLASFGASALGVPWADLAAAAIVCVFIGRTAWDILTHNLEVITDHARLDPHEVHHAATSVEGVIGAHLIRSRGSLDFVLVDLHVQVDPLLPLADAHAISHRVSDAIRSRFAAVRDVIVHIEPADGHQDEVPVSPPS